MKNKIKLLVACVLVFVMTFSFAGCSPSIEGEWKLTVLSQSGIDYSIEEFCQEMNYSVEEVFGSMQINKDGTCSFNFVLGLSSYSFLGEWEFKRNTLFVKHDGVPDRLEFKYKNNTLIVDLSIYFPTLVFEKSE